MLPPECACYTRDMLTRHFLTALALLAAAVFLLGLSTPPADPPAPVRLTIDYHDGVQKAFTALAFSKEMTVADALRAASDHPRGVKLEHKGSGETFFVVQIDDLKNHGAGKDALNWQYSVNGKRGTVGCGAAKLRPGDAVLWEFSRLKQDVTTGP